MIRTVGVQDAADVHAIIVSSLGYSCEPAVVEGRIAALAGDERLVSLVHEDTKTGRVDGFIHGMRYDTLHSEGGWDVISLAVAPEAQSRGVGKALLGAVEEQVVRQGGCYVRLNSIVQRIAAQRYAHCG